MDRIIWILAGLLVVGLNVAIIKNNPHDDAEEIIDPVDAFTEDQIDLMSEVAYAEAGNQGAQGMRYVVACMLNRLESDDFPDTVEGVVFQPGQFAHSEWASLEAMDAVYDEIRERSDYRILWFRTGSYHSYGVPLFQYGDHYFSGKGE